MATVLERFMDKISPEPNSGCWLWDGARDGCEYGILRVNGRSMKAHRLAYELFKGEFNQNLDVCHRCDTPSCANPEHLFLGTAKSNALDMVFKGRHKVAAGSAPDFQRSKTHCKNGHPFNEANTYYATPSARRPNGRRQCRKCTALQQRRYQARKRGMVA